MSQPQDSRNSGDNDTWDPSSLGPYDDAYVTQMLQGYYPWGFEPGTMTSVDPTYFGSPIENEPQQSGSFSASQQLGEAQGRRPSPPEAPVIVPSQPQFQRQLSFDELMRQIEQEKYQSMFTQNLGPFSQPQAQTSLSPRVYSNQTGNAGTDFSLRAPSPFPLTSAAAHKSDLRTTISGSGNDPDASTTQPTGEEMMHRCDFCPAAFARKRDCQRHRRMHTGELPYVCEACGERFVRSDARGRHWKNFPACESEHRSKNAS